MSALWAEWLLVLLLGLPASKPQEKSTSGAESCPPLGKLMVETRRSCSRFPAVGHTCHGSRDWHLSITTSRSNDLHMGGENMCHASEQGTTTRMSRRSTSSCPIFPRTEEMGSECTETPPSTLWLRIGSGAVTVPGRSRNWSSQMSQSTLVRDRLRMDIPH